LGKYSNTLIGRQSPVYCLRKRQQFMYHKAMLKEFKEFAVKGNAIDLAVGVIIGTSFGKIVESLVTDVIMPPIGLVAGKVDFSNLFLNLGGNDFATLAEAQAAGAPTLNYGQFIDVLINFIIIAFVIFLMVRQLSKFRKKPSAASNTKNCPRCFSAINLQATRCPNCTSEL
jgi:large conductance mechanosensitive channel